MKIEIQGHELELLPQKLIRFVKQNFLVIADLHLGKSSHFRKSGIPVPNKVYDENIETLIKLLQWEKPQKVIFLGDLFHSVHNREWDYFSQVVGQFQEIEFQLVVGNHDILDASHYSNSGIDVIEEYLDIGSIRLSHEPLAKCEKFNIYGHVHPGVRLTGKARQSLRLPCFIFRENDAMLPAFGEFTGLAVQKPKWNDRVFVIANCKVHSVSQ